MISKHIIEGKPLDDKLSIQHIGFLIDPNNVNIKVNVIYDKNNNSNYVYSGYHCDRYNEYLQGKCYLTNPIEIKEIEEHDGIFELKSCIGNFQYYNSRYVTMLKYDTIEI